MPTITIEGRVHAVAEEGRNLLDVCLSLGYDIPYFCWHPAMQSAGACRQCAVKVYANADDAHGRLVMACMTPVTDGVRVSISDPEAVEFRRSVIEWLMVNHPHDCPVCDEGGECHLQDMTVMTGHNTRRHRFRKRTQLNQDLGPLIEHEMNRCIQCYRCVRFYQEFAGGTDLDVFGWHDAVYFGRHDHGALESPFAGNLVELCPTGVFTDRTFRRHYTRSWDLQTAPSVCVHCGLGCNTLPGERYGSLRRIRSRFNAHVNGYFLCDRGRFGYGFVNGDRRVREPLVRGNDGVLRPATADEALQRIGDLLAQGRPVGIGSPRATLETNYALRALVGEDRFCNGMSRLDDGLMSAICEVLLHGPGRSPSIQDVAECDAILILGDDVPNTAPLLALSLRRAVLQQAIAVAKRLHIHRYQDSAVREAIQQDTGPLHIATPEETDLDDVATATFRRAPDDIARLGFAVAHRIDANSPAPELVDGAMAALADRIADDLRNAERPLVICGHGCGSRAIIEAATNVVCALQSAGRSASLCCNVPECNSLGVALLEAPDVTAAVELVQRGESDVVVVAENDLFRRLRPRDVEGLLQGARLVVIDHLLTPTAERAEVVLPAAAFAEATGTLVNSEGRGQRSLQVYVPEGEVRASWRWLADLRAPREGLRPWATLDDLLEALARDLPVFGGTRALAPPAAFRAGGRRIPRQSPRYSGRTAMHAHEDVREPAPPADPDSPMAFSMEGYPGQPPSSLIPRFWAPGWNSVQATTRFSAEVGGPLRGGDPGCRLIEPMRRHSLCFRECPAPFEAPPDQWLAVPAYHVFGSDELAALSEPLRSLAARPYVGVSVADATELQVAEGQELGVTIDHEVFTLPARIRPPLPRGVVTVPVGLPGLEGLALPAWATLIISGLSRRTIGT